MNNNDMYGCVNVNNYACGGLCGWVCGLLLFLRLCAYGYKNMVLG